MMLEREGQVLTDEPAAGQPAPPERCIFIVGVSRSGTTLMRRTLNASADIAIASENHFLGHVIASEGVRHRLRKFGDLSDDDNVRRLVDYLYSDAFRRSSKYRDVSTLWRWLVRRVDKATFLARLLATDRSERALFATTLQLYAEHKGKRVMGEKTPAHVRYVPTLMEWFPGGYVIHMLRDPRAIFVSELRRRSEQPLSTPYRQLRRFRLGFKLFILLQVTLLWYESIVRYRSYRQRYLGRYRLVRFEDLVRDPEHYIRQICELVGAPFDEAMLNQQVVSKGFSQGQAGFDARAADRWREHIDPWADRWFMFWFRAPLREFGYLA
ncbi:MAG TPA: sulfotransferase [Roseiflexaceae bacterium]|nr:sulfotransferase [Roseiflexaceae bacterium]